VASSEISYTKYFSFQWKMHKTKEQREGEMNNVTTPIYNPLLFVVVVVGLENRDYGHRDPSR
jgi:hypothetical protein